MLDKYQNIKNEFDSGEAKLSSELGKLSDSLVRHDIAEDKKKVLLRNLGKTEKSSFTDRLLYGKSSLMKPSKYMRLGKWLWIKENDKITPQIISIC